MKVDIITANETQLCALQKEDWIQTLAAILLSFDSEQFDTCLQELILSLVCVVSCNNYIYLMYINDAVSICHAKMPYHILTLFCKMV